MKKNLVMILAVLLLAPGLVKAAEKKTAQGGAIVSVAAPSLPQKLDLNRVSSEELVGVPGIGPRMAQAIVDLRTKKGSFKRLEDLLEVTGIKEKKLLSIAGYLEVIPPHIPATATSAPESK